MISYKRNLLILIILITIVFSLVACSQSVNKTSSDETPIIVIPDDSNTETDNNITSQNEYTKLLDSSELFTSRDLNQEVELESAITYSVTDNTDIDIVKEGIYVITGTAENVTINVEAGTEDKVQIVLDDLNLSNESKECIHIESADKVFVTTVSECSLAYTSLDTENSTGAIVSRDDIVLNGTGTLNITSDYNGIVGKDDVKITGGTYNIEAGKNCIRANDSICIASGILNLKAGSDGLHAENSDDDTKGYIYIKSCNLNIEATDDAIHAVSIVQIDGGDITATAREGIEGTCIQINDGNVTLNAVDDGINAARKSSTYTPTFEMNDGNLKINMSQGDTDGIDSNGDIVVNGGTIEVTGSSTFDYDGNAVKNGGTIIVNGVEVDTIPNQMMGRGMQGGRGEIRR